MRSFVKLSIILLLLAVLYGCSRAHPPGTFTQVDRLVATNRFRASIGVTITGPEAKRVASAVASSTPDDTPYLSIMDCQIQFYGGTNLQSTVYVQGRIFVLGETQYSDLSGVLKAFYAKWQRESYVPQIDEGG